MEVIDSHHTFLAIPFSLQEQSKRLWKVRDDLQKNCSSQELKEMLEDNGMSTHGGESFVSLTAGVTPND